MRNRKERGERVEYGLRRSEEMKEQSSRDNRRGEVFQTVVAVRTTV